ncbi:MAG: Lrp/AsnC family transcriptional regulator [Proteobacteria bacterium]|jgi:DNA-binding Lrp family transcriptional regulator|nr:Lrp/AsnC family transcriptional regulator [Pseudomonadota bacterium]MCG6935182.1 Lrp/AsnC family transcriptional regulator [Pseudomonadota bacterium]
MHRQRNTSTDAQATELGWLEQHLLNDYQHDLPLVPRPFQALAEKLGSTEQAVIDTLAELQRQGYISRVGAVFRANTIGASTLAAMAVPAAELESVAQLVNSYTEVNHNYQREHHFNLWFVATAATETDLRKALQDIEQRSGYPVLYLPMLEDYHIDLGFELQWT